MDNEIGECLVSEDATIEIRSEYESTSAIHATPDNRQMHVAEGADATKKWEMVSI